MMLAIEAVDICFSYGGQPLLRHLDLAVEAGETVVITGESGCGKTTLCGVLCGVIPGVVRGEMSGDVLLMGKSILGLPLYMIAQTIGMVFQDAEQQLIATTVEDELAFGPENLCVPPGRIRKAVDEMLRRFHLEELRHKNPAHLSGGQKKLVTIAGVLMLSPPILVLDEPMTGLDEAGRALVGDAVAKLRDAGSTVLVVEHDPALIPAYARVLSMREGRLYG